MCSMMVHQCVITENTQKTFAKLVVVAQNVKSFRGHLFQQPEATQAE